MLRTCITLDIDWNKRRYTAYIGLLFFLFMLDYFLTYLGVCYLEFGREANPFMVWLYEVPLIPGILFRVSMSLVLIRIMRIAYDEDRKTGTKLVMFGIFLNLLVLYNHIHWITIYIYLFV